MKIDLQCLEDLGISSPPEEVIFLIPMRRSDKAVTDWGDTLDIVSRCDICRVALFHDEYPYIVPLHFGFESSREGQLSLYLHGAKHGLKNDLIAANNKVCVEMDISQPVVWNEEDLTDNTVRYESIIARGTMKILSEAEDKHRAMDILMGRYRKGKPIVYKTEKLRPVNVYEITLDHISAKRSTT